MNWDQYWLKMCLLIAEKSKDQSTKLGAVIVRDNVVIATGYNGLPRGLDDDIPERHERPEKYFWFEHAERNAIYNAARVGTSLLDTTLYVPVCPCADCARGIIQVGIKVVCILRNHPMHHRWNDDMERSRAMFKEAGVTLYDDMEKI